MSLFAPISQSLFRGDDPYAIYTNSSIASTSVYTFASSTIPPGIGSLSGKFFQGVGKGILRGVETIVISRRLTYIGRVLFPTSDEIPPVDVDRVYDELLELVRPGLYAMRFKEAALSLIRWKIEFEETRFLVEALGRWPLSEGSLILREILHFWTYSSLKYLSKLETLIFLHRQLLPVPMDSVDRAEFLHDLVQLFKEQFRRTEQVSFLDEAITLGREILELRPSPDPNRLLSLINLAVDLSRRNDQIDQFVDLEEAIVLCREAFELRSWGAVPYRYRLSVLELLIAHTHNKPATERTRITNLEEAIVFSREALEQCCPFHPGQVADLEEAIVLGREALELCHLPHPDRASSLNNLASNLSGSFHERNDVADLREAIRLYHEGLELERRSSSLRSEIVRGLLNALFRNYVAT